MKIIYLIIFLAIAGKIAARSRRALNGQPISIEQAPYFMSIRTNDQHRCGGALVHTRAVFTVPNYLTFGNTAVVSNADGNDPNGITRAVNHYETDEEGMISVIELEYDIIPDASQDTIDPALEEPSYNQTAEFIYFRPGNDSHDGAQLFQVEVTLHPFDVCFERDELLCASPGVGTSIELGDIGGPLVQNGRLIGIASHQFGIDSHYIMFVDFHKFWANQGLRNVDDDDRHDAPP